ncbi:hypothetical protein AJ79_08424 [Helicocarpus griseus UAMH5409]|uniref:Bacteriophage T5 Orf172 DNA-binding domain-containing protein n=1 Tax=Helicocarpus griseus UAMH5409 TaxID=1447875 RepID=A0A2B7WSH4_9EURO|nr:hypothetical protein AJ79_08424 [Helicocarpus griseus UAMH5409]
MSETKSATVVVTEGPHTPRNPKRGLELHNDCSTIDYFSSPENEDNDSPPKTPGDAIPAIFSPPESIFSESTRHVECLTPNTDRTDLNVFDGGINRLLTPDTTPQPKTLESRELPESPSIDGALHGRIPRATKSADCLLAKPGATTLEAKNSISNAPKPPKYEYEGSFLKVEEATYGPRHSLTSMFTQAKRSDEHTKNPKPIVPFDSNLWTSRKFDFNPTESKLSSWRRKTDVVHSTLPRTNLPEDPVARPGTADGVPSLAVPTTEVPQPDSSSGQGSSSERRGPGGPKTRAAKGSRRALDQILPRNARQLIDNRCIALKKGTKNQRCRKKDKLDIQMKSDALDKLATAGPHNLVLCIEAVIDCALCSPHKDSSTTTLNEWRRCISKAFDDQDSQNPKVPEDHRLSEVQEWIKELQGLPNSGDTEGESASGFSNTKQLYKFANVEGPQSIQNFQPYQPKSKAGKTASQVLEEELISPFGEKENNDEGLIYIYWQPPNFGHLKIGKTVDVKKRLCGWEKQCGKQVELYFPPKEHNVQPVQHISRVETLVHAELNDRRRTEKCSGCGKTHIEWFEVQRDVAVEIVQKWMEWMRQGPYIRVYGTRSRSKKDNGDVSRAERKWMLSAEDLELDKLCQPHGGLAVKQQKEVKAAVSHSTLL